jgi:hypothetical protein
MANAKLPTAEQIEQRAYALYLERGSQDGHALEDWLTAEREMTELSKLSEPSGVSEQSSSTAATARAASASQQSSPASSSGAGRQAPTK